jgi:hypothetical protein
MYFPSHKPCIQSNYVVLVIALESEIRELITYVFPPHCPNLATGVHDAGGVVGTATALVTSVVGAAETLGAGAVGSLGVVLPLPFQTAGPGT